MDNVSTVNTVNDRKLDALTNEPVKAVFGGEEYILRRPTIRDYKKIKAYLKAKDISTEGKLPDDEAVDFGTFFIAILLVSPIYTQEELEDKILLTDLTKLTDLMEQMGFTKPQQKSETAILTPEEMSIIEKPIGEK